MRSKRVEISEMDDLGKWLSLGFGRKVEQFKVGYHTSKSRELPIVGASADYSQVEVTWFAQNYYFYFLGVSLKESIPATLLYPVSGIFRDVPLSGHVNKKVAPDLANFEKSYHNCERIKCFGSEISNGFGAALVIRYLQEVSRLNWDAILDVCLRKTRYGIREKIDGDAIEFEALAKLIGLDAGKSYHYDFNVKTFPRNIFERIYIDWFALSLGGSSVRVRMADGIYLPAGMPLPARVYVDLRDTTLGKYIPEKEQARGVENPYGDYVLLKVPGNLLHYQNNSLESYSRMEDAVEYPVSGIYQCINADTRNFTFNVPNVLDCALTAFFFIKVLAPLIQEVSSSES